MPWFILTLFWAIILESTLSIIQNQTGSLGGLGLDKGSGERIDYQYKVPGIESFTRATGTTYDSHSLALYLSTLIPFTLAILQAQYLRWTLRIIAGILALLGMAALVMTFSRSGWISFAAAVATMVAVYVFAWRQQRVLVAVIVGMLILIPVGPWAIDHVANRFVTAPTELLSARFDQWALAFEIWGDHFFFGYGPGNYMLALETYGTNYGGELPVHNVLLWIAAEAGIVGLVAYIAMLACALITSLRLTLGAGEPYCSVALAIMAGLIAGILDGLTDPLFREPTVFLMFWVSLAWLRALTRSPDPGFATSGADPAPEVAEAGIVGLVAYIAMLACALITSLRLTLGAGEPYCSVALAIMAGLIAGILDGLTDPLFREPTVFLMFWVSLAWLRALTRSPDPGFATSGADPALGSQSRSGIPT